ncbi:hypothetical protein BJI46_14575 [Acinetobacter qingfengensis]|uniref:C2H2-type domain-containing protein n=1 Tax=Acinetobacter qingfengensis TaxID=1262585 RepID=A0A1E7QZN8_9GAMM|nr:hypothetical protein BJI46_14575 [Acinetobacter qingfengensis]
MFIIRSSAYKNKSFYFQRLNDINAEYLKDYTKQQVKCLYCDRYFSMSAMHKHLKQFHTDQFGKFLW